MHPISLGPQDLWEDEAFQEGPHQSEAGYVYIDAHILCNPAVGDLDGDGHDELIVGVSYFFDREYYDDVVRALPPPRPAGNKKQTKSPHHEASKHLTSVPGQNPLEGGAGGMTFCDS